MNVVSLPSPLRNHPGTSVPLTESGEKKRRTEARRKSPDTTPPLLLGTETELAVPGAGNGQEDGRRSRTSSNERDTTLPPLPPPPLRPQRDRVGSRSVREEGRRRRGRERTKLRDDVRTHQPLPRGSLLGEDGAERGSEGAEERGMLLPRLPLTERGTGSGPGRETHPGGGRGRAPRLLPERERATVRGKDAGIAPTVPRHPQGAHPSPTAGSERGIARRREGTRGAGKGRLTKTGSERASERRRRRG